jgi:uncharacterized protein YcfL
MKKLLFVALVAFAFASCNSSSTEEAATTDSTVVATDSVAVEAAPVADSTAVVAE